ncbi:ABC transporter G family member 12 [Phytophthora citrophthora]|uniref:ABC transporter G family member 12 n=1 Tax=Phytophthora citrophthora TaxID=4793 RepID=A0AAD9LQ75_9STRA|nr:ABC transporter G family member 12 [Phytophthora citrophthora]
MAGTVVRQLRDIARDGNRTVIATIHQPSSELFSLFDQLYLLSDGSCVYDGPASEAVEYFDSLGFPCPEFVSPTDHFMRQLVVVDKASDEAGVARVERLKSAWATRKQPGVLTGSRKDPIIQTQDFNSNRLGILRQLQVVLSRNVLSLLRDQTGSQLRVPYSRLRFALVQCART